MRRYVLTGAPGAGKTVLGRALQARGYPVVGEAATDVIAREQARGIAEPWEQVGFLDADLSLQQQRQTEPVPAAGTVLMFDRSPLCTLALARFLQRPVPPLLATEVDRVCREQVYQRQVFLMLQLGFVVPTAARRITLCGLAAVPGHARDGVPGARLRADRRTGCPGHRARRDVDSCITSLAKHQR